MSRPKQVSLSGPDRLVAAVTLAALGALVVEVPPTTSLAVNVAFACVGPGYAVLGPRGLARFGAASVVATSLSVGILVSLALLYAGLWSPATVILCLAALTGGGLILRLLISYRETQPGTPPPLRGPGRITPPR